MILLRLEDVVTCTAAVSHVELLIPNWYFEAKTPVFTPYTTVPMILLRLEDVAMCTAAVSRVEMLIPKLYFEAKTSVLYALNTQFTNRNMFLFINIMFKEKSECI